MEQTAQRVDRLVRSLVGVDDLRPSWDGGGRLRALHVLRNAQTTDHQLARNVASGLQAALGMRVEAGTIRIYSDAAVFLTATAGLVAAAGVPAAAGDTAPSAKMAGDVPAAAPPRSAALPETAASRGHRNGHDVPAESNGHRNGHANGSHANGGSTPGPEPAAVPSQGRHAGDIGSSQAARRTPAPASVRASRSAPGQHGQHTPHARVNGNHGAANGGNGAKGNGAHANGSSPAAAAGAAEPGTLRLERLSMDRQGVMLRCRVVLAIDDHRYSAIAEAPVQPAAEIELAARVTLDALRAGALTCANLEGVGFTTIADRTYVVVATRGAGPDTHRAAAAPLLESAARAAVQAVLNVVGPITAVHRSAAERRLGKL